MKIVLLFAACSVIVNGRTLENGLNKRDLIMKALTDIRKKDIRFPQQMMKLPDYPLSQYDLFGNQNGLNEKVSQIQAVLEVLIDNLEIFKGEDDDGGEQTGELHIEIDNLNDEIRKLTDTLGEAIESSLKNPLWDLVWKLYEIYGDDFIEPFWTALDYDDIIEESIMAEEYETTGHGYMTISPIEQLTETVKDVAKLAEKITTDGKSSYNMVNAMVTALENMTSGSVKNTTSPSSAEESMESPDSSEEQAEIPSTTEGNTAEQTGTTEVTNAEQTSTPQGTTAEQTGTNEEHAENTDTTIATTESSVVRKENVLQRRLVDLLLKKLQKSAAKRGNEPPY